MWFEHTWERNSFSRVRELFCQAGTAETLCKPPIVGGAFASVDAWCLHTYNSTACSSIRAEGIQNALELGRVFTLAQGVIGALNLCSVGASMYLCTQILTHAVITESMNDIMNFLLVLPIAGSIGIGAYLWRLKDLTYFDWCAPPLASLCSFDCALGFHSSL